MVRICAVGDNVVDRYLATGTMYPGGSAANVAVHARRLGCQSGYIGIVGNDEAAAHVVKALLAEDVDISRVRQEPHPNSFAEVTLDEDGNRVFGEYRPPVTHLVLDEADLAYLEQADWIHTGHTSFTTSQLPDMRRRGRIAFDFSYLTLDRAADVLPHVTAAFFSRGDADDHECRRLIEQAAAQGPELVVVTRGAEGSLLWSRGAEPVVQPAVPTDPVDTLGAGDAFLAALLSSLAGGSTLPAAARSAATYAAEVCRHHGAFGHPLAIPQNSEPEQEEAR